MKTERLNDLEVEWWPLAKPIPYARNARVLSDSAVSKVAASIKEFGFRQPIVVDDEGVIVAGHTRLLAAERLGLATVPVHVARGLTEAQVRAYRLADNRVADETSWDYEMLELEVMDLQAVDYDLSLTGFEERELVFRDEGAAGEEGPIPEPPDEPRTKPGDLWLLGEHRLLCGDSTKAEDVERLMDGQRAVLMATDPPYLVDYDGGNHPQTWAKGSRLVASEDKTKHWDAYTDPASSAAFYRDFLAAALSEALGERPIIYQWFGMMRVDIVLEAWRANGLLPHQIIIWHKSRPVLARCDFMWDYEPCMYGWVQGKRPESERRPPANACCVWDIDQREGVEDDLGSVHPTIKPVEIVRRPIDWHTRRGELLYEPFSGSGTAIIAAEQAGRVCYAVEQSSTFVDVAVARWEAFTGGTAILEHRSD